MARRSNPLARELPLVGRDSDFQALQALLDAGARLVTITGPPGVGKSALARRIQRSAEAAGRRTAHCDLRSAAGGDDIVAVAARALGAPIDGDLSAPGDVLLRALSRAPALLILDGAEQVADHAALLVEAWLDVGSTTVLATSREPLGTAGERRYPLEPLSEEHAMRLFEDRAAAIDARTAIASDRVTLRRIVQELDCLPLALELAAARTELLSVEELLHGLLRDHAGVDRAGLLDAAIGASWQLLNEDEQRALAACSVFEGSFAVDAAQAVIGSGRRAALERLEALSRKSLLCRALDATGRRARVSMLRSVSSFASARLDEAKTRDAAELRHARWFVASGERAAAAVHGPDAREALFVLERDLPDLQAAHRRMFPRDPALAASSALVIDRLLSIRGPGAGRRALLDSAVTAATSCNEPRLQIQARIARAELATSTGACEEAEIDLDVARARAKEAEQVALEAEVVRQRVGIDFLRGSLASALAHSAEAVALHRQGGEPGLRGVALATRGRALAWARRFDDARRSLTQALALHRRAGDRRSEGLTLVRLANLTIGRGHDPRAGELLERAIQIHVEAGDVRREGLGWFILGLARHHQGVLEHAWQAFSHAHALGRELGDATLEARALSYLGVTALEQGRTHEAAELAERALLMHESSGDERYASYVRWYRGIFALLEQKLGDARAHLEAAARAAGHGEDDELAALHLASLGALEAECDDPAASGERLASARARDGATQEPYVQAFIGALEGLRYLALARAGSAEHSDRYRGRARRALAAVGRGGAPPIAFSSDVRLAARLLGSALDRSAVPERSGLLVAPDGRWFAVARGRRVDLSRRRALHLVVRRLAEARIQTPGLMLSWSDLQEAGWPGERILWMAARNRVYAAIRALRELGLENLLLTHGEGYLLDPSVAVRFAEDSDAFR